MPAELFGERYAFLPRDEILSFEEIERLVALMAPMGVRKVRITGGEPLLRHGLHELIRALGSIEGIEDIALTTNGTLLERMAGQLKREGLSRLTISLDSLDPVVFGAMNGDKLSVQRVLQGIAAAEEAGFAGMKINCVVQKGVNDHTLTELARHFKGTGHIVRFIEFMDVGTRNGWDLKQVLPAAEIAALIDAELPIETLAPNYPGEVARRWRYRDGEGEIGIITSVSNPFCGACSRARLTTDGKLVTCLFAEGGSDLRGLLRSGASDDEVRDRIQGIWTRRSDRYSEERTEQLGVERPKRVEMYQIGG
jgi:cyclic pyranopterin phosphate synthase